MEEAHAQAGHRFDPEGLPALQGESLERQADPRLQEAAGSPTQGAPEVASRLSALALDAHLCLELFILLNLVLLQTHLLQVLW